MGLGNLLGNPNDDPKVPYDSVIAKCPKKSLHIDIGWTFSIGNPNGTWYLTIAGLSFTGILDSGRIRLDDKLDSLRGEGELVIDVTGGPVFKAPVTLDLPNVQTLTGLKRRLTNLGWYAGTTEVFDERAAWAVRAFKRKVMNGYQHNQTVIENDDFTTRQLTAVRDAYGPHTGDNPIVMPSTPLSAGVCADCRMFGAMDLKRGSFENRTLTNDRDPSGAGNNGIWAGTVPTGSATPAAANATTGTFTAPLAETGVVAEIAGTFRLYLRAFDSYAGDSVIPNRVNLPQPVHMAQFVLFELGYWVVGGAYTSSGIGPTETKCQFVPDGDFGQSTQWAVREFQCYAKFPQAAKEDVANTDNRYLPRLFAQSPVENNGAGRYANNSRISGALNAETRTALQHWADQRWRCPVIVYASSDNSSSIANGSDMARLIKENLWKYDDHTDAGPRMYAIDYGGYYTVPAAHGGNVTNDATFPRPIVIGTYAQPNSYQGGPVSLPQHHHVWSSEYAEVRPDTMVSTTDPGDGSTLSAAQLSTFKVVRTAAHFECQGYFDSLNAYDDVIISFGPCHWTLATGSGTGDRNEPREMPAMLAYFRNQHVNAYTEFFGRFGLLPAETWPLTMATGMGNYITRIKIQTETGMINLSGVHGSQADGRLENTYCKTWHSYYRFQMACRTSADLRDAMWGFARLRVRDILNKTFTISGIARRVGDYATSEKCVAMLLRWHIYRPAHLFRVTNNHLETALTNLLAGTYANNNAREAAFINQIVAQANVAFGIGTDVPTALTTIQGWTNVPQTGTRTYYALSLGDPVLHGTANSFQFEVP